MVDERFGIATWNENVSIDEEQSMERTLLNHRDIQWEHHDGIESSTNEFLRGEISISYARDVEHEKTTNEKHTAQIHHGYCDGQDVSMKTFDSVSNDSLLADKNCPKLKGKQLSRWTQSPKPHGSYPEDQSALESHSFNPKVCVFNPRASAEYLKQVLSISSKGEQRYSVVSLTPSRLIIWISGHLEDENRRAARRRVLKMERNSGAWWSETHVDSGRLTCWALLWDLHVHATAWDIAELFPVKSPHRSYSLANEGSSRIRRSEWNECLSLISIVRIGPNRTYVIVLSPCVSPMKWALVAVLGWPSISRNSPCFVNYHWSTSNETRSSRSLTVSRRRFLCWCSASTIPSTPVLAIRSMVFLAHPQQNHGLDFASSKSSAIHACRDNGSWTSNSRFTSMLQSLSESSCSFSATTASTHFCIRRALAAQSPLTDDRPDDQYVSSQSQDSINNGDANDLRVV